MKPTFKARAEALHLQGLAGVRASLRLALAGRDHGAPALAEIRDLSIPAETGPLRARLYRPDSAIDAAPVMLFFHGGGFVLCDLETHDALCRRLAEAGGMAIVAVDYRLAPEAPFPAQIQDAEAAAAWLAAADLGLDIGRLALGGDSAGAYIAVALGERLNAERPGAVMAQMLIYPLLQLDDAVWSETLVTDARVLGRLAVSYIRSQLEAVGLAIPSLMAPAAGPAPATLIVTGGALDPCRPDARLYAERLRAAGAHVDVLEYLTLPHGFANLTQASAKARQAVAETGAALGQMLHPLPHTRHSRA